MNLTEAVNELENLGKFGRALTKAGEVGAALRGAEQVIRDRESLRADLDAQIVEARKELDAVRKAVESAREEARAIAGIAKKEADERKAEAADIVNRAQAEADVIRAQAEDVKAQGAVAQKRLDELRASIEAAEQTIAKAQAMRAALAAVE